MNTLPRVRVGLVGQGLSLSLSPAIHEREGRELGFDYRYEVFDTDTDHSFQDLSVVLAHMIDEGFAGSNITHPFKQEVINHLNRVDHVAETIGAVNAVVIASGELIGYNTDWVGFLRSLERSVKELPHHRVVQLGAGGAGSAVAYALLHFGVTQLHLIDVELERARQLAQRLAPHFPAAELSVDTPNQVSTRVATSDGVVNATPIGMSHHPGLPLPEELITSQRWFHDVVYMPLETELISRATQAGARVAGGGDMVVFQAAEGIRLFTGASPEPERMRAHFLQLVASGAQRKLGGTTD